jgi:serine/threonine protein phosphatase PrpC
MEKLMLGKDIPDKPPQASSCGKSPAFECSIIVRKGHEECGDSAFVYCDEEKLIAGVFDGVSGEPGAAAASSDAAQAALAFLKKQKKPGEKAMKGAMMEAHASIKQGYTTATLLFLHSSGEFIIACVGDSLVYGIDAKGDVSSELPQGRSVGDDHSIMKYVYYRNLVTSVLGPSGVDTNMHARKGNLKKGEVMILATDGLSDNLYFKVKEGYVSDTAGTEDLKSLLGQIREPEAIVRLLSSESGKRMGMLKTESPGRMLVPKQDDIAIIALRRV